MNVNESTKKLNTIQKPDTHAASTVKTALTLKRIVTLK